MAAAQSFPAKELALAERNPMDVAALFAVRAWEGTYQALPKALPDDIDSIANGNF